MQSSHFYALYNMYHTVIRTKFNLLSSLEGGNMNDQLTKAPLLELMPGLYRQETNSSVRIIYKWYAGLGGFSHTAGEVFIFILGLIPFIYSLNGIISFFKGKSNFLQSMMSFFFLFGGLSL